MPGSAARNRITGVSALAVLADLAGASIAAGAIARRRATVGLLERIQADRRAIDRMAALRRTYTARCGVVGSASGHSKPLGDR